MPHARQHRSIIQAIAITLALSLPSATLAAEAKQPDAAKRVDPDKRVCRTVQVTGSKIRQRVCYKQKEWDRMRQESEDALRNTNRVNDSNQS